MANNRKYVAFFDLLGTKNLSVDEEAYYDNIQFLQKRIIDFSTLLKHDNNVSNIGFFSDSCYVESYNINLLIDFLVNLRDDLITQNMFFNAAIVESDKNHNSDSFMYYTNNNDNSKLNNKVSGIMFYDTSVAKAYIEQNRFKGIGISFRFNTNNADLLQKNKLNLIKSTYMENHKDIYKTNTYNDFRISPTKDLEEPWISKIIESYYLACCDNSRYGKYYISLLENILYSSDNANLHWNQELNKFDYGPLIYNILLDIVTDRSKYEMLTGIDILAFSLVDRIYSSNLDKSVIHAITDIFLEGDSIGKNYLSRLEEVPENAFLSFSARDNIEHFKNHCRTYIVSKQFRK